VLIFANIGMNVKGKLKKFGVLKIYVFSSLLPIVRKL